MTCGEHMDHSFGSGDFGLCSKIPACSTARIKSATIFSSMVDGSGSLDCRIFGRLRPVRIVRKRRAMPASKRGPGAHANRPYVALDTVEAYRRSGLYVHPTFMQVAASTKRKRHGKFRSPCHLAYHTVAELAGGSSNVRFAQQRTFFENAIADHATHPSSALSIYSIGPHRRRQRRHSDPAAQ
jgi:hypothetical protein